MSVEQITDGMIRLLQQNLVARTPITSDLPAGGNVVFVDDNLHFEDSVEVALIRADNMTEFHTVLTKINSNQMALLSPTEIEFPAGSVIQKTVGNNPLFEDQILFGDREVIPVNTVSVTVDPVDMSNEWVYVQGGLSEEYNLTIMVYLNSDETEHALRTVIKYATNIYNLLIGNIHLGIVNDEIPITTDLSAGTSIIPITTTNGWGVDLNPRYEVQDNNHAEIDFRIESVLSPTTVLLNRPLANSYRLSDKVKFRRRVFYIYDSRPNRVEYGTISKNSTLFKAAKISWFGKYSDDHTFPQVSKS